jgi:hypothetical protein
VKRRRGFSAAAFERGFVVEAEQLCAAEPRRKREREGEDSIAGDPRE